MRNFLFLPAILGCALTLPASADTLYSNLGDPASYLVANRTIGASSDAGTQLAQGFRFTSAATGALAQIDLGVGFNAPRNGNLTVSLWSDGGSTVGSLLGSWDFTTVVAAGTSTSALTSVATPGGPSLTAGTSYILTMSPRGTGVWAAWNNVSATGARFFSSDNGPWFAATAGQLMATRLLSSVAPVGVPEPSSVLTLGCVVMLAVRRRFRSPR